ncbi:hypothetical protein TNCV_2902231 [Trichonephila clavipes]|nr:hypothetical protein TNCV_2902231 [Trichonephila clavipes]
MGIGGHLKRQEVECLHSTRPKTASIASFTLESKRLQCQWCDERYRNTGLALSIMVWDGIGFYCRTNLVRIAGTLNSQSYISEVLDPVVFPHVECLPSAIFKQDNR